MLEQLSFSCISNIMSASNKVVFAPALKLVHEDITSFCGDLPCYD